MMCATFLLSDGHKIGNFCYTIIGEETRNEDIRFGNIQLFMLDTRGIRLSRCETEKAAFMSIENCSKGAGRIEMWETIPVNRAIFSNKSGSVHISNNGIVFNWLIACKVVK